MAFGIRNDDGEDNDDDDDGDGDGDDDDDDDDDDEEEEEEDEGMSVLVTCICNLICHGFVCTHILSAPFHFHSLILLPRLFDIRLKQIRNKCAPMLL